MKLEQSFEVAAPLEQVWDGADRRRARRAVPARAPRSPGQRRRRHLPAATFTVKLGPTTASYRGALKMEALDEASRTATMHAKGTDKRGQGGANATIVSTLREEGGETRGRRRHRLHDHRPPGALRARRDDRGHLQAADARLLAAACRRRSPSEPAPRGAPPRRRGGRARDARRGGRRRRGVRRRRRRRGLRGVLGPAAAGAAGAAQAASRRPPSRCTASVSCSPCCGSAIKRFFARLVGRGEK